ncbi:PDZ domain-containing protein [Rubripirellula amarantea]|uniref:PDZ domain-containing protein n=1 Tax=Rubripirellula amarantea TaxID=2527999 RepID=A0A5C5WV88_9BACT|nr:PDZ domain-containing protein [Rubripirellula amarantea]MDA8744079.1 PDZ domain-containing protein [Rubripirellula amarantea]TWT54528.1 hypothetical protein Pla22_21750 [Rubripirellula amarantea]
MYQSPFTRRISRFAVGMVLMFAATAKADPPAIHDEQTAGYWVLQLSNDHYLRRELAEKKLVEQGPEAIAALVETMRSGDLESIERATSAISQIAINHPPAQDGGAWDELENLSRNATGRIASSAKSALREIGEQRSERARVELASAGVFVGIDDFMIGAISTTQMIVQIDDKFHGDDESLQWLRWLTGVEKVRVMRSGISKEVLENVAQMPNLRSLAIVDGKLQPDTLVPLEKVKSLETLEFRYVPLTDELAGDLERVAVRNKLSLMGTGLSKDRVRSMNAASPDLTIEHRQGGFLGVKCYDGETECEISDVIEDSAAEEAGLIRSDVIVQINDAVVKKFKDLQDEINQHVPGDELTVKFRRGAQVKETKVTLRRYVGS